MVFELLNNIYYNNALINWIYFLLTIMIFLLISKSFVYFSKNLSKNVKKNKKHLGFVILDLAETPISFLVLIFGIFVGYQFLSFEQIVDFYFYNSIQALTIFGITWIIIKLIDIFLVFFIKPITSKTKNKFDDQIIRILSKALKVIVIILAIIISLDNFGFDVITLIAGLGIGGLAIAFAAQKTISDIFGGLNILISRPFILGDSVEINGVVGTVEEISLRHTRIRNLDKRIVIFPNSTVSENIITNIASAKQRRIIWTIGVTYDTPITKINKAKKIIINAIETCDLCEKKPVVYFDEFANSSLNVFVLFFTKTGAWGDMMKAKDEVGLKIKKNFEKEKIEFAFPTQTIHLNGEIKSKLVKN